MANITEHSKEIRILAHNASHAELTQEQRKAYAEGAANYYEATGKFGSVPDEEAKQELYLEAFNLLAEYVDDVVSENYLLLFAIIVQKLQDYNFDLSEAAISKKIEIYLKFIKEYQYDSTDDELYEHLLDKMYINLGFILLEGVELRQDENLAHLMFDICRRRGLVDSSEKILRQFEQGSDGKWYFCSKET